MRNVEILASDIAEEHKGSSLMFNSDNVSLVRQRRQVSIDAETEGGRACPHWTGLADDVSPWAK